MEENDLRNAATKDVATKGGQYDIMTVGAYEVPIWGQNRWLVDLTDLAADDPAYDVDDFFQPVRDGVSYDDRLYAVPFYGESSFLMYRKDLFEQAGLKMPERPTWDQVAEFAKQAQGPSQDRAGICLRGKPGWGEMFAPLTTVDEHLRRPVVRHELGRPGQHARLRRRGASSTSTPWRTSGEGDPVSFGFTECLNLFSQERAAMWYDATSAAGSVEDRTAPRWPARSATSGRRSRRPRTPAGCGRGTSASTPSPTQGRRRGSSSSGRRPRSTPSWSAPSSAGRRPRPAPASRPMRSREYIQAGGEFAPLTAKIMSEVNPKQPGVNPQPWVGIQYVTIPEFQDVGNQTSQLVADAIAGRRPLRAGPGPRPEDRPASRREPEEGLRWSTRSRTMPTLDKPLGAERPARRRPPRSDAQGPGPGQRKFARKLICPGPGRWPS